MIRNGTQGADQDECPKKEVTVSFYYLSTTFITNLKIEFQKKKAKKKSPVNLAENREQMIVNQDLIVMSVEDRGMKEGEVQIEVEEDMTTIGEDMKMIEDIAMTEIEKEDGEGIFHDFPDYRAGDIFEF